MRRRDPSIPLFLWIATAALVHILWGGGAEQVATVVEGERSIARLADSVRSYVKATNQRIEISLADETLPQNTENAPPSTSPDAPREPLNRDKDDSEQKLPTPKEDPSAKQRRKLEAKPPKTEDLKERKPADKAEQTKKAEPKDKPKELEKAKEPDKLKPEETPAKPAQKLELDRRIAVDQHVEPNQKDNPDARFIGDKANRVTEETQAKLTARDQNDKNPTLAKDNHGADNEPGDSDANELGRSEDQAGEAKRSPVASLKPDRKTPSPPSRIAETSPNLKTESARPQAGKASGTSGQAAKAQLGSKGQTAQEEHFAKELVPNTALGNDGKESSPVASERQSAQAARLARLERYARQANAGGSDFGSFGIIGNTPSGLNPNLTPQSAFASVGEIQLAEERRVAAETRRSRHKGSWKLAGLERWRAAIENYVATVQPGNQTALNTAAVPFARYLNQMHQRIHEHFADSFLASLESLPSDHR